MVYITVWIDISIKAIIRRQYNENHNYIITLLYNNQIMKLLFFAAKLSRNKKKIRNN